MERKARIREAYCVFASGRFVIFVRLIMHCVSEQSPSFGGNEEMEHDLSRGARTLPGNG